MFITKAQLTEAMQVHMYIHVIIIIKHHLTSQIKQHHRDISCKQGYIMTYCQLLPMTYISFYIILCRCLQKCTLVVIVRYHILSMNNIKFPL